MKQFFKSRWMILLAVGVLGLATFAQAGTSRSLWSKVLTAPTTAVPDAGTLGTAGFDLSTHQTGGQLRYWRACIRESTADGGTPPDALHMLASGGKIKSSHWRVREGQWYEEASEDMTLVLNPAGQAGQCFAPVEPKVRTDYVYLTPSAVVIDDLILAGASDGGTGKVFINVEGWIDSNP